MSSSFWPSSSGDLGVALVELGLGLLGGRLGIGLGLGELAGDRGELVGGELQLFAALAERGLEVDVDLLLLGELHRGGEDVVR